MGSRDALAQEVMGSRDALAQELLVCKAQLAAFQRGFEHSRIENMLANLVGFSVALAFNIWLWVANTVTLSDAAAVFAYLGVCGGEWYFCRAVVHSLLTLVDWTTCLDGEAETPFVWRPPAVPQQQDPGRRQRQGHQGPRHAHARDDPPPRAPRGRGRAKKFEEDKAKFEKFCEQVRTESLPAWGAPWSKLKQHHVRSQPHLQSRAHTSARASAQTIACVRRSCVRLSTRTLALSSWRVSVCTCSHVARRPGPGRVYGRAKINDPPPHLTRPRTHPCAPQAPASSRSVQAAEATGWAAGIEVASSGGADNTSALPENFVPPSKRPKKVFV